MAKLGLSQQILFVIASPSLLVILRERSDRRISSSVPSYRQDSGVRLTRINSAKQAPGHFWDCGACSESSEESCSGSLRLRLATADTRYNNIWG